MTMPQQIGAPFWYYTLGTTVLQILGAEKIPGPVWLSCRQTWEPRFRTRSPHAASMDELTEAATIAQLREAGGVLARLEVCETVARYTWQDHRRSRRIDAWTADRLERVATEVGADPSQWRVSYDDVAVTHI